MINIEYVSFQKHYNALLYSIKFNNFIIYLKYARERERTTYI